MHGSGTENVHLIPTPRDDEVVLRSYLCLNMAFVTISSNSEHGASRSSPLELHFPIPCVPMTKGHLSLFLPILAFRSPISSSLSVGGMPFQVS